MLFVWIPLHSSSICSCVSVQLVQLCVCVYACVGLVPCLPTRKRVPSSAVGLGAPSLLHKTYGGGAWFTLGGGGGGGTRPSIVNCLLFPVPYHLPSLSPTEYIPCVYTYTIVALLSSHLPGLPLATVYVYLCPTTAWQVCRRLNTSPVYMPIVTRLASCLPVLSNIDRCQWKSW